MAVYYNLKGTTQPFFQIGKQGTTLYQGPTDPSASFTIANGDFWFDTDGELKVRITGSWTNFALSSGAFHDTFSDFVSNEHINHTSVSITGSGGLTGGGDITTSRSISVATDGITNTMLRNSGALSVIGRSANTTGDPADISAVAASGAVLRESGSTIGFGTIATAGLGDNVVTNAKMRDSGALSVIGRSANTTGDPADISAVAASGAVLRESGSTIGFGTIATAGIANDAVTNAKIRNSGALSVIGRSANSSGDPADISAVAASGAVLRESGSTIGFGTIATAGIADAAVTFAKVQNITDGRLLGRSAGSAGVMQEITVGSGLTLSGGSLTLNAGTIDHGTLTGLGDDDHPQYPLAAGTETITGAWTFNNTVVGKASISFELDKVGTAANAQLRASLDSGNDLDITNWLNGTTLSSLLRLRQNGTLLLQDRDPSAVTIFQADRDRLDLQNGVDLRIRNTANTDYGEFSHDGTDFYQTQVNTRDLRFWGHTGNVIFSPASIGATVFLGGSLTLDNTIQLSTSGIDDKLGLLVYTNDGVENRRAGFYLDSLNNEWGAAATWSTGNLDFVLYSGGAEQFRAVHNSSFRTARPIYPEGQTVGNIRAVTGDYGSIEVEGADGSSGTWRGVSIGGRHVFMDNGGTVSGLYNDTNNEWLIQCNDNAAVHLYYDGGVQAQTALNTADGQLSGFDIKHADGSLYAGGFNLQPIVTVNANISSSASWKTYAGKIIMHTDGTARTYTVPASTDTTLPVGYTVNLYNASSTANIIIAQGSGITIRKADGSGGTGNRDLQSFGFATLIKISSSEWILFGSDLT